MEMLTQIEILEQIEFLRLVVFGNTLARWFVALAIALVALLVFYIIKKIIFHRISEMASHTKTSVDDMASLVLQRTNGFLVMLLAIYLGSLSLNLPDDMVLWIHTIALITFIIQFGMWLDAALVFWLSSYYSNKIDANAAQVTTVHALGYIVRVAVVALLLIIALDNIPGVEVTALLASLGVAGIAVALALQSVLADLFASLVIAIDKPFVINDFIIVGEFMGTVEKIGIKTTRLRSLSGEQVIFSNSDMLNSRIRNYRRMWERRIVFSIGVTYETPYAKLSHIPTIIQKVVESQEKARFDRAHFASYGDSSLNFEIVYYVLSADYNEYMDVQQTINMAIFKLFEEAGISFAYPTRTVYVANPGNGTAHPGNAHAAHTEADHQQAPAPSESSAPGTQAPG
jgi:small-conductance mechanosensitive channel